VLEFAGDHGYAVKIKRMGIPDYFVEHGTQQELWHECGYDTDGIRTAIEEACGKEHRAGSMEQGARGSLNNRKTEQTNNRSQK
jgi:1-deoxy-D-xylulose-5-phosphate synthase